MTTAIRFEGVTKRFLAPGERRAPFYRQLTGYVAAVRGTQRLALDTIDLEVLRGTSLGVVGRNGAGKTTLLRMIAGIYTPTTGRRAVHGRIACHFGGEAGLAPTLSVVDNLYLFGAMLGMGRSETKQSIDVILDLAELRDERGARLEHLSFGKQQRLFFGVMLRAMQLRKADIFLFDEWLAGADRRYQERAEELLRQARAPEHVVLIASHDVDRLRRLCDAAIYLRDGRVAARGDAAAVLETYANAAGDGDVV